jgi:ankyrin repeat protein
MDTLINMPTKGHIKEALKNLAMGMDGLDKVYEQAMGRIEGQGTGLRAIAKQVLMWIVHAKRQLSTAELQHALAVRPHTVKLDADYLPSIGVLQSVCAGLVTVDEESDIIRLVHYTAQEYFERTQGFWFPDAQGDITTTCLTYLSFDTFETGFCPSDEDFEERLQQNPFYSYAARNWGCHALAASFEVEQLVLDFLENGAKVSGSSQALIASGNYFGYSQNTPEMTGVHLAAYFGLSEAIIILLNNGHDPDPDFTGYEYYGRTPLFWAVENGHDAVVKLLLAKEDVDPNSKGPYDQTPLLIAAENGHEAVVKLLLAKDSVNPNSRDSYSRTPLSCAVENGHEAVVKLLLAKDGVDLNFRDRDYRTLLSFAAENGHEAVVKLLLAKDGVDPNSKDLFDRTPLWLATKNGHEAVVKLLLAKDGVDLNYMDDRSQAPPF